MNIDKKKFNTTFIEKGWSGVAIEIKELIEFIAGKTFDLKGEKYHDIVQEAWIYSFEKKDKCKPAPDKNFNPWSFFWTNSFFKMADILRKEKRRRNIAKIHSFDGMEQNKKEVLFANMIDYI